MMNENEEKSVLKTYNEYQNDLYLATQELFNIDTIMDEKDRATRLASTINTLQDLQETFKIMFPKLKDIKDIQIKRDHDYLINCAESDLEVIRKFLILLNNTRSTMNIQNVATIAQPDLIKEYNVLELFRQWGDQLNELDFKNVSYEKELQYLLIMDQFQIKLKDKRYLDRIECAALITQALIRQQIKHINFSDIINYRDEDTKQKLSCILHYILNVCEMMQNKDVTLTNVPITIKHNVIDKSLITIANNFKRINTSDITVEKFVQYHRYRSNPESKSNEYRILFVDGKVGDSVYGDRFNYESIVFMRCPEMYVLPKFINHQLGNMESYSVLDIKQYNVLTSTMKGAKRASDASSYRQLTMYNFIMHNGYANELPQLDDEISKLYSGVYFEQLPLQNTQAIFKNISFMIKGNKEFQFLIDALVCLHLESRYEFCSTNEEEMLSLKYAIKFLETYTISELYNKLSNYDMNVSAAVNLNKTPPLYNE
ncbi:PARG [Mythimna sequax nucleopolyhedrovirus]|nr:PARG [Mythimna sequax nucleopolyhedrovirus]